MATPPSQFIALEVSNALEEAILKDMRGDKKIPSIYDRENKFDTFPLSNQQLRKINLIPSLYQINSSAHS